MPGLVHAHLVLKPTSYDIVPEACPGQARTRAAAWDTSPPMCVYGPTETRTSYCPAFMWAAWDTDGTRRITDLSQHVMADRSAVRGTRRLRVCCLLQKSDRLPIGAMPR